MYRPMVKVDDNTCSSDEDTPVSDDKDINTNGDGGCESGAGQDTGISAA